MQDPKLPRHLATTIADQERLQRRVLASTQSVRDAVLASKSVGKIAREAIRVHEQGMSSLRDAIDTRSVRAIAQAVAGFNAFAGAVLRQSAAMRIDVHPGATIRDRLVAEDKLHRSMMMPVIAAMRTPDPLPGSIQGLVGMTKIATNLFGIVSHGAMYGMNSRSELIALIVA